MNLNEPRLNKRSLIAGFSGNILEWYDFTVYGFFATIIGAQFFPHEDKVVQLISAFGVFAAGYLMRPIGGVIFGYIGDRKGRKKALMISVMMMAIPTTLIGFLPTYENAGWYASMALVLLRLFQGLSVGGEFTGSISFLVEQAPKEKRGFYGSWSTLGVFGGMLLGSGLASLITRILSEDALNSYGWRIPFLFGALIGIVGLYLRKGLNDEQSPRTSEEQIVKTPIAEFWAGYKLQAIKIILLSWCFGVSVYLIFIFLPSYLDTFHQAKLDDAMATHTIAMIVLMLMIPLFGKLTDRIGRKPILLLTLLGFVVATYPLFKLMFEHSFVSLLAAMLCFAILQAMFQAVMPALMTEAFPKRVRYTGLSVSYNIAMALFGGTTPLVCTWLVKVTGGNVMMPAYYLIATAVIALITMQFLPETYRSALR